MKTIKERAILHLEYERDFLGNDLSENMVRRAYIRGATEQKVIDIDKACDWLKERVQCGVHPLRAYGFAEEFRKAMEE